jgi:pimeloyl-ACP methyl ester carboxylesterase
MPFAHVNGIDIRYEDSGGDGPTVLFSHGFLMDHTMFDPQVAALSDGFRCVRWDERGFGGTHTDRPFTYWDSADDAVGLLDHLGIDQAVFVGMSQGGFLSMRAAIAHPDRVRAIVLLDSSADPDDDEMNDGNRAMVHVLTAGTPEARARVWHVVAGVLLGDDALSAHWIPRWDTIDDAQLTLAGECLVGRDDLTPQLGEIACPVLSIHGTDDQPIAMERAEALAAALPDSRGLLRIEGGSHAANLTHPSEVNAALADFLRVTSGM